MNKNILHADAQDFISKNLDADIISILLKKSPFDKISSPEIVAQIEAKKKCLNKLPTWFKTPNLYYPKKINIEQTSSEITAQYKSQIVSGKRLLDLTGGFGIDSYFFSNKIEQVSYNELDQELVEIVSHNFEILGKKNIKISRDDAINFLKRSTDHYDWIYVDPDRRNKKKGKVFLLEDCLPDVTKHLELFFDKADHILLKTSPLLDISLGIKTLHQVAEVHIIAVRNEVKELLWVLKKSFKGDVIKKTINFTKAGEEIFDFKIFQEKIAISKFGLPEAYLYVPNAAILKSGGFKIIGDQLNLNKLAEHTHLYTSKQFIDFPGKRFTIQQVHNFNKKTLKKLNLKKANIATRNFPLSVSKIRIKFNINDGGDVFLFFFKNCMNTYQFLVCSKKF